MIESYLEQILTECQRITQQSVSASWVTGSLANGDFSASQSDIDLVMVVSTRLTGQTKDALTEALDHRQLPCPTHGLDLIVYRKEALPTLSRTAEYEYSISTGIDWKTETSFGGPYPGGLIDLAAARQFGRSLQGAHPRDIVQPIPEQWILEELLASVQWHLDKIHDPFHDPFGSNAVLNACRALYYFETWIFASKTEGAQYLLTNQAIPVVSEALNARLEESTVRLDKAQVASFVRYAIDELEMGIKTYSAPTSRAAPSL